MTLKNLIPFIIVGAVGISMGCCGPSNPELNKDREMLKEHFLFKCIYHGYPESDFAKYDCSGSLYFELGHYAPEAYRKLDSVAKYFVGTIITEGTYYEEEGLKSVYFQSFEYLKSEEFDDFIVSLDTYRVR